MSRILLRNVATVLTVLGTAMSLTLSSAPGALAADTGHNICLTNHAGSCVDVKDGNYTQNQPLWLFTLSGAQAAGFDIIGISPGVCAGEQGNLCDGSWGPFTDHFWDAQFDGDSIMLFAVSEPNTPTVCLGELGGSVQLRNCGDNDTNWVRDGDRLINVERTDALDNPEYLSAATTADKASLTMQLIGTGWEQWTIKCEINCSTP
jgi:hypothetical protein